MRLSEFILSDMDGILQEWEDYARTLPPAAAMNTKALRDGARQILCEIAREMATEQTGQEQTNKSKGRRDTSREAPDSAAQSHAGGRLIEGFTLPEMVSEYRALRASVIRRWIRHLNPGEPQQLRELTRFNEGIDQALSESVQRFSDRIDRGRELFMGALGHDLRTPLHVIMQSAEYLQRPEKPGRSHADMVQHIVESADNIHQLVEDLLDVVRTRVGGVLPINAAPMELQAVCERVVQRVRSLHSDAQIDLHTSGDLRGVWDEGRMEQLVTNLLNNALQHGDKSWPIQLKVKGDAKQVVLSVRNQGEPIPENMRKQIFEAMRRVEPQDGQRRTSSLGLGLYIARGVARAHNGHIGVESSRKNGTVFTVRLPREQPQSIEPARGNDAPVKGGLGPG